jgi:hypothetical protein
VKITVTNNRANGVKYKYDEPSLMCVSQFDDARGAREEESKRRILKFCG